MKDKKQNIKKLVLVVFVVLLATAAYAAAHPTETEERWDSEMGKIHEKMRGDNHEEHHGQMHGEDFEEHHEEMHGEEYAESCHKTP